MDLFKDGVSLPGLVLKYLINSTKEKFYLFNEKDNIDDRETRNHLFYLLNDSITRYHELFKTLIRGGSKICKQIIGYDANVLCFGAISQYMHTGKDEHIKEYNITIRTRYIKY